MKIQKYITTMWNKTEYCQMASVWEERFKEEAEKTIPLQEVRIGIFWNNLEKLGGFWNNLDDFEEISTNYHLKVCSALREDMELQHKKRMESIDIKMDKIPFRSKGPSREVGRIHRQSTRSCKCDWFFYEKENYKILAIRTLYEIASLHPRLKHTRQRAEFEERVISTI